MILTRFVFCSLLLLGVHYSLFAQAIVDFKASSPPQAQLGLPFTEFSVHQLPNKWSLESQISKKTSDVTLQFGAEQFALVLRKTQVLSNEYLAHAIGPNQTKTQVFIDVETYEGHLKGHPDKTVKLTTADQFIYGFITGLNETYYIEPMNRFDRNSSQIVFYPASAVTLSNTKCAVSDQHVAHNQLKYHPEVNNQGNKGFCKEVHLAMVHDYSMFQKYNENIETLFAYTIGVLNNVQSNFNLPFNGNLVFKISEQLVPICETCDPWTSNTDPGVLLLDFLNWGNQQNFVNNFHIGQFWTNRELDGSTVGYAYVGATCSPFNYQVIQDFSTNANQMRMVVAHELGHNLNAQHNTVSTGNIMDPVVSMSTTWTSQSVAAINAYVTSLSCLTGCQSSSCQPVSNLVIGQNLHASWSPSLGNQFKVEIVDKDSESVVFQHIQHQNYFDLNAAVDLCKDYLLKVTTQCNNQESLSRSALLKSSYESKLEVTGAAVVSCDNGLFDIELEVIYSSLKTGNFIVEIKGDYFYFDYTTSPQIVIVNDLVANGDIDVPIKVYDALAGSSNCEGISSIDAPDSDCNIQFVEQFDNCQLPIGWTINNVIDTAFNWKFGGSVRPSTNYPSGTINGTCMAYFDDDLSINSTGILVLESPTYNLNNYENLQLKFNYDFHSFSGGLKPSPHDYNNSSFKVEAWDGNGWNNVFTHQGADNCLFNQFWSCPPPQVVVNLDPYKNAALKIRFIYNDDGKWAGAVGLDDVRVSGSSTCGNYDQVLRKSMIQHADSECTDDTGWTHYWHSSAPEMIILSIFKNNDPTFNLSPGNVETGVNMNEPVMVIPNGIPYVQHPDGFNVLSRYWNVAPQQQPTNPVSVRFYYTEQELTILMDQAGLNHVSDLIWFKFSSTSGVDPNPGKGHLEAQPKDFVTLQPVLDMHQGIVPYAEFTVTSFSGGGVGGYTNTLPVELVSFNGTVAGRSVVLDWSTHSEQNSHEFLVERSQNSEDFTVIGSVAAAGNSSTVLKYQMIDRNPRVGVNYYRLKQVDLDGTSEYSDVIAVRFSKGKGMTVMSANPGTGPLLLGIEWNQRETVTVYLTGIDGRQLKRVHAALAPGFNRVELNTDGLGAGSYFVHVEGNDGFLNALKVLIVN